MDEHWSSVFKALLTMCADGMSSEDSEIPVTGGTHLRKRNAIWRSKELQGFLRTIRSHMTYNICLIYAAQDQPLPSRRAAPACLAATFYDQVYVAGLSTAARAQLNIQ